MVTPAAWPCRLNQPGAVERVRAGRAVHVGFAELGAGVRDRCRRSRGRRRAGRRTGHGQGMTMGSGQQQTHDDSGRYEPPVDASMPPADTVQDDGPPSGG